MSKQPPKRVLKPETELSLDVAIVGGGVSGVYSAWRLLTARPSLRVAVFEADGHIGGRLLSVKPPHISDMQAELGGMRILPAVQPKITRLIEELNGGVKPSSRIEAYDFPVDQPDNISYLRGTHLRLKDFTENPAEVPYHLTFQEFGKTSGQIVVNAIDQIVPGIIDPSLTEEERRAMAQSAIFAGEPLYQQGFWDVLLRVMSNEAYQMAVAAGGYETTLANWNAADAIPWFLSDFGVDPEYKGFKKGFQQVPLTLAERVRAFKQGSIHLGARLSSFKSVGNEVELQFADGRSVRAKHLILAMPRRSLDLLAPNCPFLQIPSVSSLIKSVTPRPLFKLFTTYTDPWWLPAGVKAGRSTTDLPARQTYYWPTDQGLPALKGKAMLMASYDDGTNIGFWDGFRPKRGVQWTGGMPNPNFKWFHPLSPNDPESAQWYINRAPERMVLEIQRQLAEIHGLKYTPASPDAAFKDWGDDPFGGGWNSWNIGVQSQSVKDAILKPEAEVPVYICGEAYSNAQGWVEGALDTADAMLKKYFAIPPLAD